MARGIDELIEWLIVQIAYSGEQGFSILEFIAATNKRIGGCRGQAATISQNVNRSDAELLQKEESEAAQQAELEVARIVWGWIVLREEILVGKDGGVNHLSLDEVLALPEEKPGQPQQPTASHSHSSAGSGRAVSAQTDGNELGSETPVRPRMFASEQTLWEAVTGHGVDYKKIPRLEWKCLLGIASAQKEGILQGDLRQLVNQDKRSVPKRTDFLAMKGYIVKRTTVAKGCKTSRLWLKGFAPVDLVDATRFDLNLSSRNLRKDMEPVAWRNRWMGENIDYSSFCRTFLAIIKAWKVMRLLLLKEKMGVSKNRRKMRALAKECRSFAAKGIVKYVAAAFPDDPRRVYKDCIKWVREPTKEEWVEYLASGKKTSQYSDQTKDRQPKLVKQSTLARTVPPPVDEDAEDDEDNNYAATPSFWAPEKPLANVVLETVQRSGLGGLSIPQLSANTIGYSFRRFLFSHLTHMASEQPQHLKHLQLRSRMVRIGKTSAYMWFQDNVAGQTTGQEPSEASVEKPFPAENASRPELAPKDPFGFAPIPQDLKDTTISELSLELKNHKQKGKMRSRRPEKPTKSRAAVRAHKSSAPIHNHFVDTENQEDPAPPQPLSKKRKSVVGRSRDAPAAPPTIAPEETEDEPEPVARPPGVYIGQPGSLQPFIKRPGRPKKSLVLIIRSDKLKDPELLKNKVASSTQVAATLDEADPRSIIELGEPVPDSPRVGGSEKGLGPWTGSRFRAVNAERTRTPADGNSPVNKSDIEPLTLHSSYHGSPGSLCVDTVYEVIRFAFDANKNPLVIAISALVGDPAVRAAPNQDGKAIVFEARNDEDGSIWPYIFLFEDVAKLHQSAADIHSAIVNVRSSDNDVAVISEDFGPPQPRLGRPFHKRKASAISKGASFVCDKCGNSWKNEIGLKYHRTKSKTSCNPHWQPVREIEETRKRRKIERSNIIHETANPGGGVNAGGTSNPHQDGSKSQMPSSRFGRKPLRTTAATWASPRGLVSGATLHGAASIAPSSTGASTTVKSPRPSVGTFPTPRASPPAAEAESPQLVNEDHLDADSSPKEFTFAMFAGLKVSGTTASLSTKKRQHSAADDNLASELVSASSGAIQEGATEVAAGAKKHRKIGSGRTIIDVTPPVPGLSDQTTLKLALSLERNIAEGSPEISQVEDEDTYGEIRSPHGLTGNDCQPVLNYSVSAVEDTLTAAAALHPATPEASLHISEDLPHVTQAGSMELCPREPSGDALDFDHTPASDIDGLSGGDITPTTEFRMPNDKDTSKMARATLRMYRCTEVMKYILHSTGGVFPADKALWFAILSVFKKAFPKEELPHRRTCSLTVKRLEAAKVVSEHTFAFKDGNGKFVTYRLLIRPDLDLSSPLVADMKHNIQSADPHLYIPPMFMAEGDELKTLEALDSYQSTREKRTNRNLPETIEILDVPATSTARRSRKSMTTMLPSHSGRRSSPSPTSRKQTKRKAMELLAGTEIKRLKLIIDDPSHNDHDDAAADDEQPGSDGLLVEECSLGQLEKPPSVSAHGTDSPPRVVTRSQLKSQRQQQGWLGQERWHDTEANKQLKVDWANNGGYLSSDPSTPVPSEISLFQSAVSKKKKLPRTFEDIRRLGGLRHTFKAASWKDKDLGTWYHYVDGCMKWELSEHGTELLGSQTAAPSYIFIEMPFTGKIQDAQPTALQWRNEDQLSKPSFPYDAVDSECYSDDQDQLLLSTPSRAKSKPLKSTPVPTPKSVRARRHTEPKAAGFQKQRELTAFPRTPEDTRNNLRAGLADESEVDWKADDTRIAAFVSVRTLLGGVDNTIDYGLMMRLFPDTKVSRLRLFWQTITKTRGADIEKFKDRFQQEFLHAYKNGVIPLLDYDDVLAYDWKRLVAWTLRLVVKGSPELPQSREMLEQESSFVEGAYQTRDWRDGYFLSGRSIWNRIQDITSEAAAAPAALVTRPIDDKTIARSWVRALTCTAITKYSTETIKQKILTLGDRTEAEINQLLEVAIRQLQKQRVVRHSKGRALRPNRHYELGEPYNNCVRRHAQVQRYTLAAKLKGQLDECFRAQGSFELPFLCDDGMIMALVNLQAHGRVKFEGINLPNVPFGFEPGNYESRKFPKTYHHFKQRVVATDRYIYNEDIGSLEYPTTLDPPGEGSSGELPIWCDFLGDVDKGRWAKILGASAMMFATRGAITAWQTASYIRPVAEPFEVQMVIDWCIKSGLLTRVRGKVVVSEWWWLIVAQQMELSGCAQEPEKRGKR